MVMFILLYRCTTWMLTKLDGKCTKMLQAILIKSWKLHPLNQQLYGLLPPISKTIQIRQARHVKHCWRSKDKLISDVLPWIPSHEQASVGQPARTYLQQHCIDTRCNLVDQLKAMDDWDKWQEIGEICANSTRILYTYAHVCVCIYIYIYIYIYIDVCVSIFCICIYIYICVCVCVYVHVCNIYNIYI